jgi:4-hydroxy-3-methylbut-2-enyl diphosphate reductase
VESVIKRLDPRDGVTEIRITTEDEYFPPPRAIRRLQDSIESAARAMLGGAREARAFDDRTVSASDVLRRLGSYPRR